MEDFVFVLRHKESRNGLQSEGGNIDFGERFGKGGSSMSLSLNKLQGGLLLSEIRSLDEF